MKKALIAISFAMIATSPAFASSGASAPRWVAEMLKSVADKATPAMWKNNAAYYKAKFDAFNATEAANLPADVKIKEELKQLKEAHKSVDRQAASNGALFKVFANRMHAYFSDMEALVQKQDHVGLRAKLDTVGSVINAAQKVYSK